MYLDAGGIDCNVKSRLTSSTVYQLGKSCLTFWYHVYGYGMGKLNIYVSVNDKEKRLLNISGNKKIDGCKHLLIFRNLPLTTLFLRGPVNFMFGVI
jgi:hypothetical protein